MENLMESESTLGCKVKDVTSFIKQHTQSIRNEVLLRNKEVYKVEKEQTLIKLRQSVIQLNNIIQAPNGPSSVADFLPEVLEVLFCVFERYHTLHLTGSDIKNLRLVNKEWRQSIDKYFARTCSRTNYGYFKSPQPKFLLNDKSVNKILKLLTTSAPTSMPYSVQSVIVNMNVNCPTKYSKPQFLMVTKILQIIGKSVKDLTWKIDIESNQDFPSPLLWYKRLRNWLASMPNLTALELSFKVHYWSQSAYETFSTRLEEKLFIKPFPNMKKLAILKVAYNVPNILLTSAIQQNPTIQILRVSAEYPVENKEEQVLGCLWYGFSNNFKLNNLTELHIKDFDNYIETTRGTEFDIKMLQTVNWPLKTLALDFEGASRHDYANRNLYYLCSIANKFEQTLTNLRISSAGWTPSTDVQSMRLKLPHLEHLYLFIEFHPKIRSNPVHIDVDFDFILECPLLKRLDLYLCEYLDSSFNPEYLEEVIQLQGYFSRLYESQIWELLPALQNVNLSTSCQFEKGYDNSYRYNRKSYKSFLLSSMA